jgi:hypothetical protein
MNNSTTGKMTLLAAATLMATTVGMVSAQAADTGGASNQHKCPDGQSIFIKMDNPSATQIKGECQQIKQSATHIKMESSHIKIDSQQSKVGNAPGLTVTGNTGNNVLPSTQIKQSATHIKLDATHVKGEGTDNKAKTAREAGSGMATGR